VLMGAVVCAIGVVDVVLVLAVNPPRQPSKNKNRTLTMSNDIFANFDDLLHIATYFSYINCSTSCAVFQ
jgi:hypothetical protein